MVTYHISLILKMYEFYGNMVCLYLLNSRPETKADHNKTIITCRNEKLLGNCLSQIGTFVSFIIWQDLNPLTLDLGTVPLTSTHDFNITFALY